VVIAAYLRKKEHMKAMDLSASALVPTGDTKMDEKRAKECVFFSTHIPSREKLTF
jgi:hypothetical protein